MRKAILIGINYIGQQAELRGCISDIEKVQAFLSGRGFTEFVILRDDRANALPTRAAILQAIMDGVLGCTAGDVLYIHYSGHGSYMKDLSGDEVDGQDECICPVDYQTAGMIIDDELNIIVCKLAAGARLRVVFDACHSGSALDLPIRWIGGSKTFRENNSAPLDKKGNPLDIVFLSGCQDSQTSADAFIAGDYNGALTYAWLQAAADALQAAKTSPYTWKDIGQSCQLWLKKNGYSQIPQLGVCVRTQLLNPFDL